MLKQGAASAPDRKPDSEPDSGPGTEPGTEPERTPSRLWNRNFSLLWAGLVQSYLGDAFLAIGLMWLVLERTGSPAAAGTILAVQGIPKLLGPLAGVVVDRSSKRHLMIGSDWVRCAALVAVFLLHRAGALALWHLYALVVVLGAAAIFYGPSLRVLLPRLVPDAALPGANSTLQASEQMAMIAGASLAGLLVAAVGAPFALLIDGITFGLAALALTLVTFPRRLLAAKGLAARQVLRDFVGGLRYVLGTTEVLMLTVVVFASNLVLSPANVIFPVYSAEVLDQGVKGFGFLASAIAIGFLLGSVVAGILGDRLPYAWAIFAGLFGIALALVGLGATGTLVPALLLTGALGMVVPLVQIPLVSRLQRFVPEELQGRVFATVSSFVSLAVPLGAAIAGQALALVPVPLVFRGAAAGVTAVAIAWFLLGLRGGRGVRDLTTSPREVEP